MLTQAQISALKIALGMAQSYLKDAVSGVEDGLYVDGVPSIVTMEKALALSEASMVTLQNEVVLARAHDERVTELLEANNREVERRRGAENENTRLRGLLSQLSLAVAAGGEPWQSDETANYAVTMAKKMAAAAAFSHDVIKAAEALIVDVRRRHPGEELRCPYMIRLDEVLRSRLGRS